MSFEVLKESFREKLGLGPAPEGEDVSVLEIDVIKPKLDKEVDDITESLEQISMEIIFKVFPTEAAKLDTMYKKNPAFNRSTAEVKAAEFDREGGKKANVPCNSALLEVMGALKESLLTMSKMCNTLGLWVKLKLPEASADPASFQESIRAEVMEELNTAEQIGFSVLDMFSQYHNERGEMIKCVLKYPHVDDFFQSLVEFDDKMYLKVVLLAADLRSLYLSLYDDLSKNFTAITVEEDREKLGTMY